MGDNTLTKLTWAEWLREARLAGEHYWCYAEFVDDNPDGAKAAYQAGDKPYDYILKEGEDLDLHRFGAAWS